MIYAGNESVLMKVCFTKIQLSVACWVKIIADNILKYFSYSLQKIGFEIVCTGKLSPTICMQYHILLSAKKKKKNITNLSSAVVFQERARG